MDYYSSIDNNTDNVHGNINHQGKAAEPVPRQQPYPSRSTQDSNHPMATADTASNAMMLCTTSSVSTGAVLKSYTTATASSGHTNNLNISSTTSSSSSSGDAGEPVLDSTTDCNHCTSSSLSSSPSDASSSYSSSSSSDGEQDSNNGIFEEDEDIEQQIQYLCEKRALLLRATQVLRDEEVYNASIANDLILAKERLKLEDPNHVSPEEEEDEEAKKSSGSELAYGDGEDSDEEPMLEEGGKQGRSIWKQAKEILDILNRCGDTGGRPPKYNKKKQERKRKVRFDDDNDEHEQGFSNNGSSDTTKGKRARHHHHPYRKEIDMSRVQIISSVDFSYMHHLRNSEEAITALAATFTDALKQQQPLQKASAMGPHSDSSQAKRGQSLATVVASEDAKRRASEGMNSAGALVSDAERDAASMPPPRPVPVSSQRASTAAQVSPSDSSSGEGGTGEESATDSNSSDSGVGVGEDSNESSSSLSSSSSSLNNNNNEDQPIVPPRLVARPPPRQEDPAPLESVLADSTYVFATKGMWVVKALQQQTLAKGGAWRIVTDPITMGRCLMPSSPRIYRGIALVDAIAITSTPQLIMQSIPPFTIVHVNRAFSLFSNIGGEDIIGKPVETLFQVQIANSTNMGTDMDEEVLAEEHSPSWMSSTILSPQKQEEQANTSEAACQARVIPVIEHRPARPNGSTTNNTCIMSHILLQVKALDENDETSTPRNLQADVTIRASTCLRRQHWPTLAQPPVQETIPTDCIQETVG